VLAHEGELFEVVGVEKLLQRVDDLIRLGVAENVDNLAMPSCALGINHIPKRIRLDGRHYTLARRLPPCLFIHNSLQTEMSGVGLALDIDGDAFLHVLDMLRSDAPGGIGESDGI
jgi:uncharacterized protein YlaN (UPF0358 family)